MFIRKAHAGNAPGHTWHTDGQVIEVEDELARQLLNIPHGGFSEADPPAPEPEVEPETVEQFDEEFAKGEPVEVVTEEPKRAPGRPRLPRDENGNIIRR